MESTALNTLYVNNINEKVKKNVLKKMLYMLFSQYGKVIQVVACKGIKLRGQAWVVFQDAPAALSAMKGKQNFNFYGKPLHIQFAKSNANVVERKGGVTALPANLLPGNGGGAAAAGGGVGAKRQRDEDAESEEESGVAKEARKVDSDE
eukprot:gene24747-29903_t